MVAADIVVDEFAYNNSGNDVAVIINITSKFIIISSIAFFYAILIVNDSYLVTPTLIIGSYGEICYWRWWWWFTATYDDAASK